MLVVLVLLPVLEVLVVLDDVDEVEVVLDDVDDVVELLVDPDVELGGIYPPPPEATVTTGPLEEPPLEAFTVHENAWVVLLAPEDTFTVKVKEPLAVGVPESVVVDPVAEVSSVTPAGRLPLARLQVYGEEPPLAVRVSDTALPSVTKGSEAEVVMESEEPPLPPEPPELTVWAMGNPSTPILEPALYTHTA